MNRRQDGSGWRQEGAVRRQEGGGRAEGGIGRRGRLLKDRVNKAEKGGGDLMKT